MKNTDDIEQQIVYFAFLRTKLYRYGLTAVLNDVYNACVTTCALEDSVLVASTMTESHRLERERLAVQFPPQTLIGPERA